MAINIDLLTWSIDNEPSSEMIYKKGYWDQILFIRDTINSIFYSNFEDFKNNPVLVINTHMSKSIDLPVYEINLRDHNTKIIMRNNFYDWKVSVDSPIEINANFMDLFKQDEVHKPIYCEGFKDNQVFDCYANNKKQFTLELKDKYRLYTFIYILNNYLKNNIKGEN